MADVTTALEANREALEGLIAAAAAAEANWTTPRAPGKWSPQQVVEHVAIALEEGANVLSGAPSKFPSIPGLVRPIMRGLFFNPTVRKGKFPTGARAGKAMSPESGPATAADARPRLEQALARFDDACRARASSDGMVVNPVFGRVSIEDYARFSELHTRHHTLQIPPA